MVVGSRKSELENVKSKLREMWTERRKELTAVGGGLEGGGERCGGGQGPCFFSLLVVAVPHVTAAVRTRQRGNLWSQQEQEEMTSLGVFAEDSECLILFLKKKKNVAART